MKLVICFILSVSCLFAKAQTTNLTVNIVGIDAKEGNVLLALYTSELEFLGDDITRAGSAEIKQGRAVVTFENLPFGKYAISTFFDRNANGILDTNLIGVPKEPYAFSMNAKGNFGPPSFEDAAFSLNQSEQALTISY